MQWKDLGILLSVSNFSENKKIANVFCREKGKVSGLVRGARSLFHVGDVCHVIWSGKDNNQLGTLSIDVSYSIFGRIFNYPQGILALDSSAFFLRKSLPDRVPHISLFNAFKELLAAIAKQEEMLWLSKYVFFEMELLAEAGLSLDLSKCTVTGATNNLMYVSPKTARAVSEEGAGVYKDRLLKLPQFMISRTLCDSIDDIFLALRITGHFLRMYFYGINIKSLPISRSNMLDQIG